MLGSLIGTLLLLDTALIGLVDPYSISLKTINYQLCLELTVVALTGRFGVTPAWQDQLAILPSTDQGFSGVLAVLSLRLRLPLTLG